MTSDGKPILRKLSRKFLRNLFRYDPEFTDWYSHPNFKAAGAYYLERIVSVLNGLPKTHLRILDIGSHSGRITIPLIQAGYVNTMGIDTSGMAVRCGNSTLASMGLGKSFKKAEAWHYLRRCPSKRFDVILCIGVLCLCPHYRAVMKEMARCLRVGGSLVITFKTKFFVFNELLKYHHYDEAHYAARHPHHPRDLKGQGCSWQTRKEMQQYLHEDGFQLLSEELNPPDGLGLTYPDRLARYLELYPMDRDHLGFLRDAGVEFVVVARKPEASGARETPPGEVIELRKAIA